VRPRKLAQGCVLCETLHVPLDANHSCGWTSPRHGEQCCGKPACVGTKSSAAWREVSTCVMPWRFKVMAMLRMITNMTTLEKSAPTRTSMFRRPSSSTVAPFRLASVIWPDAFSSSTSSLACPKNKYRLIVVSQRRGPREVLVHVCTYGRKYRQRVYAGIPGVLVYAFTESLTLQARMRLRPFLCLDNRLRES